MCTSDLHLFRIAGHWIPVSIIPICPKILGLKRHHLAHSSFNNKLGWTVDWQNRLTTLLLVSNEGIFAESNTNLGWKLTMQGWVSIFNKIGTVHLSHHFLIISRRVLHCECNLIFHKSADYRCWKNADVQTDFALMLVTMQEKCWVC